MSPRRDRRLVRQHLLSGLRKIRDMLNDALIHQGQVLQLHLQLFNLRYVVELIIKP